VFDVDDAVTIHHNWISGDEFKWERTRKWNAIVSDDYHSLGESSALADRLQLFKRKLNETWF
jgi:hypothetical protein